MDIVVSMKNVTKRGETFYFRLRVPQDCIEHIGRREITESLRTSDPLVADRKATARTNKWKLRFKEIRKQQPSSKQQMPQEPTSELSEFQNALDSHIYAHLPSYLESLSEQGLKELSEYCFDCIGVIKTNDQSVYELERELGIKWPLEALSTPGLTRKRNRAVLDAVLYLRHAIDEELGVPFSKEFDARQEPVEPVEYYDPTASKGDRTVEPSSSPNSERDIVAITHLMLEAKNSTLDTQRAILREVNNLVEWSGGKKDITAFTKADLVDFVRNCLVHIPTNMHKKKAYKGKSLKTCIKLTQKDPTKYPPISHRTCKNRMRDLNTAFN